MWRGDTEIALSTKEFAVLETFMRRPGRVLSRFELLEHAWDYEYDNRSNVVDAYVRLLRKKIDKPFGTNSIETVRGAGYRLREENGRVSSLPVRVRVTLTFTIAMAALLAALGAFLYLQLRTDLNETINDNLRSRLGEVQGLVATIDAPAGYNFAFGDEDETFVQVLRPNGTVVYFTQAAGDSPLVTPAEIPPAGAAPAELERSDVPNLDVGARLLVAPPDESNDLAVVVGATLDDRDETLARLATLLLIGGPDRPAPGVARRILGGRVRAAPGRADAPPRRRDLGRRSGRAPSGAAHRRRARPPRDDAERDARAARGGDRARAPVRRRREPRASHPACPPSRRARAGAALRRRTRRACARRSARRSRRSTASSRSPRRSWSSRVRARTAWRSPASRSGVGDLFETVTQRFRGRVATANRSLVTGEGEELMVSGDRLRLEQALTGLVDNALRHGAGEVRLWAEERDGSVVMHVTDEGPGFPEDFIAHAFERFSRADQARGRGGAGLGLAIVDTIARAHGGSAAARNRSSSGADVSIEVPAATLPA